MSSATEPSSEPPEALATRAIDTKGRSLRAFTARGVIVNAGFDVGLTGLGLIRGLVLAALLTRVDYGVWGILTVSLGVLSRIKLVGIGDKYIQQEETDQELAFQKAFTFELLTTAATLVLVLAALPVIVLIYGQERLVPLSLVMSTMLVAGALQTPFWVFYRDMDYVRQRTMLALEPIVGFVVAVVLALLGFGYWALALGATAGAWAGAILAIATSRYPLRWRYDRGSLKLYASFSGPIFVATVCSIVLANGAVIAANAHLGVAAVGAIALSANITIFTNRIDDLVSTTLYPAICAMQDRLDLLRESFVKSNRLALMWGMPFGVGLTLFAGDLVHFALGDKWRSAITLLQITGLVAAIAHIGFNWDDYFRARADTRPVAVQAVAAVVTFLVAGLPLLFAYGLTGLAIGIGLQALATLVVRAWYLARLFEGFVFVQHAMRAIIPTVPAVAVVLLMRQFESGPRTPAMAVADLVAYLLTTGIATWIFERSLLREAVGYVIDRANRAVPSAG